MYTTPHGSEWAELGIRVTRHPDASWSIDALLSNSGFQWTTVLPVQSGMAGDPLSQSAWADLLEMVRSSLDATIRLFIEPT